MVYEWLIQLETFVTFLLDCCTNLFQLTLRQLQLDPPAGLFLLHTALESLQDALLWTEEELQFGQEEALEELRSSSFLSNGSLPHRLRQHFLVRLAVLLENLLGLLRLLQLLSQHL